MLAMKIDLNNKYRVLLTEVLPYEIPLMLNNEGFYKNMQDEELQNIFEDVCNSQKCKDWTIPFDYFVSKYGGDKSRKLSLMHPCAQLKCVNFYEENNNYMLYLCKSSPFSIRYIVKKAKCIFEVDDNGDNKESDSTKRIETSDDEIEKKYRSYFCYKKYDMMYKFFNSGDYLRLEQKYSHLMNIDIASCFYHIYTHTIAWAIKGKEQSKNSIQLKKTFEHKFDKLMQQANYNETNGIIVGPEISRIFAEIILQRIDINVLNRLKEGIHHLRLGKDYEVRRYVDDYYIFANNEDNLQTILRVYKEELQYYKLFINESKLEFHQRPFVSDLTDAKREINSLMNSFDDKYLTKNEECNYKHIIRDEMKVFKCVVNEFRSISHRYNQKYGNLNRYFLSLLLSQIEKEFNRKYASFAYSNLLLLYTEVGFYIFSLDMNTTASIKMCKVLDSIDRWAKLCNDKNVVLEVENKIQREIKRCLDIYEVNNKENETNIVVLNLLLCVSRLNNKFIPKTQLLNIFKIENNSDEGYSKLNYFQICTILYIMDNDKSYDNIRTKIISEINRRLNEENALKKADNIMLFFDVVVCPYIPQKDKQQIFKEKKICNENKWGEKYKVLNKNNRWFFDWDKSHSLAELISKKEYHHPYE